MYMYIYNTLFKIGFIKKNIQHKKYIFNKNKAIIHDKSKQYLQLSQAAIINQLIGNAEDAKYQYILPAYNFLYNW